MVPPITCHVAPRPDATPDQLRALGAALRRWYAEESTKPDALIVGIDEEGLASLDRGEPPPAVIDRHCNLLGRVRAAAGLPPLTGPQHEEAFRGWVGRATDERWRAAALRRMRFQSVWFDVRPIRDEYDREGALPDGREEARSLAAASLRRAVPAELLGDIVIGGKSWGAG